MTNQHTTDHRDRSYAERTSRLGDLVPPLADRHVLVVGCGSVGSMMADILARHGVGSFTLVDPDYVELPNLSRSPYGRADVGRPKVEALADHLRSIDGSVRMTVIDGRLDRDGEIEQAEHIKHADLVVVATDDPVAQASLNHRCYALGRPAIFPALYRGAAAGEIVITVPEATHCWTCATGSRPDAERPQEKDYGTGRLVGETALGTDILTVVSVAAKQALGLLTGSSTPVGLQTLTAVSRHSMCIISTEAEWSWFPQIFGAVPGQFAPQSIWLDVTGSPECPVCGTNRQAPLPPLDLSALTVEL